MSFNKINFNTKNKSINNHNHGKMHKEILNYVHLRTIYFFFYLQKVILIRIQISVSVNNSKSQ